MGSETEIYFKYKTSASDACLQVTAHSHQETQTPDWETNKLVDQIRAEGLPMLYLLALVNSVNV